MDRLGLTIQRPDQGSFIRDRIALPQSSFPFSPSCWWQNTTISHTCYSCIMDPGNERPGTCASSWISVSSSWYVAPRLLRSYHWLLVSYSKSHKPFNRPYYYVPSQNYQRAWQSIQGISKLRPNSRTYAMQRFLSYCPIASITVE